MPLQVNVEFFCFHSDNRNLWANSLTIGKKNIVAVNYRRLGAGHGQNVSKQIYGFQAVGQIRGGSECQPKSRNY
jgi:hypothetical protein